jgi:hypothetical protein
VASVFWVRILLKFAANRFFVKTGVETGFSLNQIGFLWSDLYVEQKEYGIPWTSAQRWKTERRSEKSPSPTAFYHFQQSTAGRGEIA